jgi:serine protease Do
MTSIRPRAYWLAVCLSVGLLGGYAATTYLHGQAPPAAPRDLPSYRDVVKKVVPAVVSIEAKAKAQPRVLDRKRRVMPDNVPEEFRKFFEELEQQNPRGGADPQVGFGSGLIVDAKGVVLTNYHVIEGAESVEVALPDGRKFTSKDIRGDKKTDLAIIKLTTDANLPFLEFGDSDAMEVGDKVLAVGAPFGLTGTVTSGIVSAKSRSLRLNQYEDFLQTDAAINPGNSGGPLVNLAGQVIGINSAIKSRTGGFQGVGLAISSNLAKQIMTQLLKEGVVRRGYLGVQIRDLEPEVATRLGVKEGVLVARLVEDGPAGKAGVQAGDVIVSVAGKPVRNSLELQKVVASLPLKQAVELSVRREGKPLTLNATIEEMPGEDGAKPVNLPAPKREGKSVKLGNSGVEVSDLSPDLAKQLGFTGRVTGAVIVAVTAGSTADLAGLAKGMVISKIDKRPVESAQACQAAFDRADASDGALLQIESVSGGTTYVVLKKE